MTTSHPTRFDIERMSAGLIDGGQRAALEAHLSECSECREYRDHLEAVRESLHEELPPNVFAAQIFERESESAPRPWRLLRLRWVLGGALATAAVVALIVLIALPEHPPDPERDDMRLMGSSSIRIFLRRGAHVSTMSRDEPLRAGDALRVEVTVDRPSHIALLAITDGEDEPFALCPDGPTSLEVGSGQVVLPGSVEVTENPEPARLLLILREEPFEVRDAVSQVHAAREGRPVVEWEGEGVDDVVWTMIVVPE